MAAAPTEVCNGEVVAGYGPPCCMAQVTARLVGHPFQMIRPPCPRAGRAARERPRRLARRDGGCELTFQHLRDLDQVALLLILDHERDGAENTPQEVLGVR